MVSWNRKGDAVGRSLIDWQLLLFVISRWPIRLPACAKTKAPWEESAEGDFPCQIFLGPQNDDVFSCFFWVPITSLQALLVIHSSICLPIVMWLFGWRSLIHCPDCMLHFADWWTIVLQDCIAFLLKSHTNSWIRSSHGEDTFDATSCGLGPATSRQSSWQLGVPWVIATKTWARKELVLVI